MIQLLNLFTTTKSIYNISKYSVHMYWNGYSGVLLMSNGSFDWLRAILLHLWQLYHMFLILLVIPGQYTVWLALFVKLVTPGWSLWSKFKICDWQFFRITILLSSQTKSSEHDSLFQTSQNGLKSGSVFIFDSGNPDLTDAMSFW